MPYSLLRPAGVGPKKEMPGLTETTRGREAGPREEMGPVVLGAFLLHWFSAGHIRQDGRSSSPHFKQAAH